MRVLGDSWCFCNGGSKSERIKGALFTGKAPSIAKIKGGGTGILIHRNLLLTTHTNFPSVAAAENAEIRLHNGLSATLFPHRFYITSSVLDLTIVGLDVQDGESNAPVQQPHHLKTCSKSNFELGSLVYFLGYSEKQELEVGEGKVVIATDNLVKLSTDGVTWGPGCAGFDVQGNLAFMVCDPMKLATSPNTKSSSTSSSSASLWKKDVPLQFGIPIPIIFDWLNQHWEGNLDELNKPKLPLIRLMSSGQKSEHSCASFSKRRIFKTTEGEYEETPTSSKYLSGLVEQSVHLPSSIVSSLENKTLIDDTHGATHMEGIHTPKIYESSIMTSGSARNKDETQIHLLDINFPPKIAKTALSPQPSRKMLPNFDQHYTNDLHQLPERERNAGPSGTMAYAESTGSYDGALCEAQSSYSPSDVPHEYSSEGDTTMYSAETAESRNYTSPRRDYFNEVGRSQSWGAGKRSTIARGAMLEKHQRFMQGNKVYSQGATSQRSNDYFSPTVSSIMKKRNNLEQQNRPRQSAVHSSPRWMF